MFDDVSSDWKQAFNAEPDVLISLLKAGLARVEVRYGNEQEEILGQPYQAGIHPDGSEMAVNLQTPIQSTHLYLRRTIVEEIGTGMFDGDPSSVELIADRAITDPVIESMVSAMQQAVSDDHSSSGHYVGHMVRALGAHLLYFHSTASRRRLQPRKHSGFRRKDVDRVREIIEARLGERLSLSDLAEDSGLSPDHFIRVFKQATGATPYQFVIQCRIERAQQLLKETDWPISTIALECGFSDQVHLTRKFSATVGLAPASYRKLVRQ